MTHLVPFYLLVGLLTLPSADALPDGAIARLRVMPRPGQRLTEGPVFGVAFAPDGKTVVTAGNQNAVCLWDPATGQLRGTWPAPGSIRQVVFSPDGKYLAALQNEGEMLVWDFHQGGQPIYRGAASLRPASAVAFAPGGSTFVWGDEDGGVYFWDLHKQKLIRGLSAASAEAISGLRFTGGGATLVLINRKGQIERHDLAAGKLLGAVDTQEANHRVLHLSPSTRLLVLPGIRREVRVRESASGQETGLIPDRDAFVSAVCFSPDGRLLALGVQAGVELWSLVSGELVKSFSGHNQTVTALAFAPDGRTLASTSKDGTAVLWHVPTIPPLPTADLKEVEVAALWQELASAEAPQAYRALRRLAQAPRQAIALLKERLQPLTEGDRARLKSLLRQLNDESFERREQATTRLRDWGERVQPAVLKALHDSPSPEVRRRLEQVLESGRGRPRSAEELRRQRSLTLLEWLNTPESQKLLHKLSEGPPEDLLTHEAKATGQL